MEAEVYAIDSYTVLKIYSDTIQLDYLTELQRFYASLDQTAVSYSLPDIQSVIVEGDIFMSIERTLPGTPMSEILPMLSQEQMDKMMETYITAALELTNIQIPSDFERYKLFDTESVSLRENGDWHHFLTRYLAQKLSQVSFYLEKDVTNFAFKIQQLYRILAQPYTGNHHLIHGDFFPGNILIQEMYHATALLDFGLWTMYGDHLFDIATGWVFFDMYDELKSNLRDRFLAMVLGKLGEKIRGRIYRYVLLYSILSANTYSSECNDGHYQWCVDNLNYHEYWDKIE